MENSILDSIAKKTSCSHDVRIVQLYITIYAFILIQVNEKSFDLKEGI